MDTTTSPSLDLGPNQPASPTGPPVVASPLTRRGFLRSAAMAGGGLVAVGVAACAPAAGTLTWTYGPTLAAGQPAASASAGSAAPSMDHSPAPSASAAPVDHVANALAVVKRFLDGEAATLPLAMSYIRRGPDGRRPSSWSRRSSASERDARRGMLLIVFMGIAFAMAMVLVTALASNTL